MRAAAAVLALALPVAVAAVEPEPPRLRIGAGGAVLAELDPSLLEEPEIERHLTSGLTTNFVITLGRREGGARLAVRFEPWDEVFHVAAAGVEGEPERRLLRNREELASWWSAPGVVLARGLPRGTIVEVRMDVLPFSASEEADAKRWLAQALAGGDEAAVAGGLTGAESAPSLFSAVIGSSIRRKPVVRYRWRVRLGEGSP